MQLPEAFLPVQSPQSKNQNIQKKCPKWGFPPQKNTSAKNANRAKKSGNFQDVGLWKNAKWNLHIPPPELTYITQDNENWTFWHFPRFQEHTSAYLSMTMKRWCRNPHKQKKSKESSLINKHPNSVWDRAPHLETGEDLYNFWNVEKWRITFLSQKCMSMSFEMSSKRTHPKQTVFQQTGKYLKFSKHNKIISFHSNRFFFHSEITWTKFWPFF